MTFNGGKPKISPEFLRQIIQQISKIQACILYL